MKRIFFLFLLISHTFLNGNSQLNETDSISQTVLYGDYSGIVGGHVSVITGDFIDYSRDLEIPAPVPLTIDRNYASKSFSGTPIAHGWNFNDTAGAGLSRVKKINKKKEDRWNLNVITNHGSLNKFETLTSRKSKLISGEIQLSCYFRGFTNTSGGLLTGQNHIKNQRFEHVPKSKEIKVIGGDGTEHLFTHQKNNLPNRYFLRSTRFPSGNQIIYGNYEIFKSAHNIYRATGIIKSVDESGQKTFASILCSRFDQKKKKLKFYYDGKKGRYAGYTFRVKEGEKYYIDKYTPGGFTPDMLLLREVQSSLHPTVQYEWEKVYTDSSVNQYRIKEVRVENELKLAVEYNSGYVMGNVQNLKAPVGVDDTMITTHRFEHWSRGKGLGIRTDVYDAYNNLTEYYQLKSKRLMSICRYQGSKLYTCERFEWGKSGTPFCGNLMCHWIEDCGQGIHIVSCKSFSYDERGNSLTETIHGKLTGDNCSPVKIDLDKQAPISNGHESYTIYRTYSQDGLNLLLSETAGSKKTEFTYYPNTNLVKNKLIKVGENIQIREFYEYDENKTLTKKIVDNGVAAEKGDLVGVSHRMITLITPSIEPVVGLPEKVEQRYLDLDTGQERSLGWKVNTYDANGKVIQEDCYDAEGVYVSTSIWDYNSHGKLLSETDPLGNTTVREYDKFDNLIREIGPRGDVTKKFVYDHSDRLIAETVEVCGGGSYTKSYGYDLLGQKIWECDIYGNRTKFVYDPQGRLIRTIYADGAEESVEYDVLGNPIKLTNANGHSTLKAYNSRSQVIWLKNPDGTEEHYRYDLAGRLVSKTHTNGAMATYRYDGFDRVVEESLFSIEGELLSQTTKTYNAFHLLSETDPMGYVTYYTYDGAGRVIQVNREGCTTAYEYDSLGREHKKIEGGELVTVKEYDLLNRVIQEREENTEGDIYSNKILILDTEGRPTIIQSGECFIYTTYNNFSDPEIVIDAEGNETRFVYDYHYINEDHLCSYKKIATDPKGVNTCVIYDLRGRIAEETKVDSFGRVIQRQTYDYDSVGNRVVLKCHRMEGEVPFTVRWSYDSMGRVISQVEADKKTTRFSYNLCGQKESLLKPDGVVVFHEYDRKGRLQTVKSSDETVHYEYRYNRCDQVTSVVDQLHQQTTTAIYTAHGLLDSEILQNGLECDYSYDTVGRITQIKHDKTEPVLYTYDGPNIHSISFEGVTHVYKSYDLFGNPLEQTLAGNAGELSQTYDKLQRITEIKSPHWTQEEITYDSVGNLTELNRNGFPIEYAYDHLNQLIEESGEQPHTYEYDSIYNRTKKDGDKYRYDKINQLLGGMTSAYQYDASGNMVADGVKTYVFDALDRLIEVKEGHKATKYTYDYLNRRISKAGDELVAYLYQGQNEVGACVGGELKEFRVLGKGRGAENGATVVMNLEGTLYAPVHDVNGNIATLVDVESGELAEQYRYSTFGEGWEAALSPWGFSGKRYDQETGFFYFGRRYYSPELGRWITSDPLGYEAGVNTYAYVMNAPLTSFDEYGLLPSGKWLFTFEYNNTYNGQNLYKRFSSFLPKVVNGEPQVYFDKDYMYHPYNRGFGGFGVHEEEGCKLNGGSVVSTSGICNDYKDQMQFVKHVSNTLGGVEVSHVRNPTQCLTWDTRRYILSQELYLATPAVETLHKIWYDKLQGGDHKILQVCHSEGVCNVRNALMSFDEELRKRIQVVAIAPSAYIDEHLCGYVKHYVSPNDEVPYIDKEGFERNQHNIVFVEKRIPWKWFSLKSHEFTNDIYKKHLIDEFDRFKRSL